MRLSYKLIGGVFAGIIVLLFWDGYLSVKREIAASDTDACKVVRGRNQGYRYTYGPAIDVGGQLGTVEMSGPLAELESYTRETRLRAVALGAAMAAVAGLGLWIFGWRSVGRPLQDLVAKTRRIGEGDLEGDLATDRNDELGTLAGAMNEMCVRLAEARRIIHRESEARLAALDQLRHSERLATIGRIASGLAHELGTPLNVVDGHAKLILTAERAQNEVEESCRIIREQVQGMTGIIRQLLDFSRRRQSAREPVVLHQLVERVVRLLEPSARKGHVSLSISEESTLPPVPLASQAMEQVLMNLVMNAIQAMPDGGEVRVILDRIRGQHPDRYAARTVDLAAIRVCDTGEGIASEDLDLIFEPFFTTKRTGEGTGLGLSIVRGIVEEHDGWVTATSTPGAGSTFSIHLPLAGPAGENERHPAPTRYQTE